MIKTMRIALTLIVIHAHADTKREQINTLDRQITVLTKQMRHNTTQSAHINQAILATEKQIGESTRHLYTLQKEKTDYDLQLKTLHTKFATLKQQLTTLQTQLAKQLQLRYHMHHEEPLILRLIQDDPDKTNHLFTLYGYLLQIHYQTITALKATQTALTLHKTTLQNKIQAQATLEKHIQAEQKTLQDNKLYHQAILTKLHQQIQTQAERLVEFKQNRRGLTRLISTLTEHAPQKTRTPFNLAFHRLNYPIAVPQNHIEKKAHGVLFKAQEGTAVRAIAAGRVVFSDWLKGYGLLIIIDHGNGLMSLYAHNQTLLKDKNQRVANGDAISSVGHTGGIPENGLYFELRQHGKVVSPSKWLA